MPYLYRARPPEGLAAFPPAQVVKRVIDLKDLSHFEYFRLCLSAHYLTCGTPVPTDVDNQIRLRLWPKELPLEVALQVVQLVLESRHWNFTVVSSRHVLGAPGTKWEKEALSGHLGEWFTVSAAAYCALGNYADAAAQAAQQSVRDAIADEVDRHSEIFASLMLAKDGVGCLKAAASIAHNFGDLDRVMDMWDLSVGDPLRLSYYKLARAPFDSERRLRYRGRLWIAGELYQSKIDGTSLALENHRHFALRKPRSLREERDYIIPTAPFFDEWGQRVARGLADSDGTPSEKSLEILAALKLGWDRQPGTVAYGRGLVGMLTVHSEFRSHPLIVDALANPVQRTVLDLDRAAFEKKWNDGALKHVDEIPARAV